MCLATAQPILAQYWVFWDTLAKAGRSIIDASWGTRTAGTRSKGPVITPSLHRDVAADLAAMGSTEEEEGDEEDEIIHLFLLSLSLASSQFKCNMIL